MTNCELLKKYDTLEDCHNWIYVECKKTGARYIASFNSKGQIALTHSDPRLSIIVKEQKFESDYTIERITNHFGDKCYYENGVAFEARI